MCPALAMLSVPTLWTAFVVNFLALGLIWAYVSRSYPKFEAAPFWTGSAFAASFGGEALPGDAASEAGVATLISGAADLLDGIDLYCANAGIARPGGEDATELDWEASWQVNVMAHVRAARLLTGPWLEQGSGHLICTVSAAGLLTELLSLEAVLSPLRGESAG